MLIHRDADQHSRQFILDHHITPVLAQFPEHIRQEIKIIPLIIKHEQETWLFADLDALAGQLGGNLDRQMLNLPPDIETRANTKELFQQVVREASKNRSRRQIYGADEIIERLAETIRLTHLAPLPSYQHFIADLNAALRQIGYIR